MEENVGLPVQKFLPGGHGGGQQVMARIACEEVDMLLFFRDPIAAKPSEPNEMNLLRICDVHNIPWPPTSPPPRFSSTAWSTATSTGAPSCTRRMRKSQKIAQKHPADLVGLRGRFVYCGLLSSS